MSQRLQKVGRQSKAQRLDKVLVPETMSGDICGRGISLDCSVIAESWKKANAAVSQKSNARSLAMDCINLYKASMQKSKECGKPSIGLAFDFILQRDSEYSSGDVISETPTHSYSLYIWVGA